MARTSDLGRLIGVALLPVIALAGAARGEGDVASMVKKVLDTSVKLPERENTLTQVVILANNRAAPKRAEALRPALSALLKEFHPKRADPAVKGILLQTFAGFSCYDQDPELAPLCRPYLDKATPDVIRRGAVNALNVHGAAGMSKELVAIFAEPSDPEQTEHEGLLRAITLVVHRTPAADAIPILTAATRQTTFQGVRVGAIRELADFANTRPADVNPELMRSTLQPLVNDTNMDVATVAASTIQRFNSWGGIESIVQRNGTDPMKWTRETYRAVCRAVFSGGGFDGVEPEKFYEYDNATRAVAIASMLKRWDDVKSRSPDEVFYSILAGAGVKVPTDRNTNPEIVAALIDGLDSESREIRYASLDMFVRKTGRTDIGQNFKTLLTKTGPKRFEVEIRQPEPPDGFEHEDMAAKLREQQKAYAKELHGWWDRNAKKAELKNGVWVVPPEKDDGKPEKPKKK